MCGLTEKSPKMPVFHAKPRCAQRFRSLVAPLAEAFHGTAVGDDRGTLPVAALNKLHKKFCAPLLVAVVDACGDRSDSNATRPDGSRLLDATPLAHMYAHTGQANLVLKLAAKGYAVEGSGSGGGGGPSSKAAPPPPQPLASVLVRQGLVAAAWQVIHADPDRGLEPGARTSLRGAFLWGGCLGDRRR